MILYLDTSALLKRYFKEPYTDEIVFRWKRATGIVTSSVAYAETMASFYRKKREATLGGKVIRKIVDSFRMDWQSFTLMLQTHSEEKRVRACQMWARAGSDRVNSTCPYVRSCPRRARPSRRGRDYHASVAIFAGLGLQH